MVKRRKEKLIFAPVPLSDKWIGGEIRRQLKRLDRPFYLSRLGDSSYWIASIDASKSTRSRIERMVKWCADANKVYRPIIVWRSYVEGKRRLKEKSQKHNDLSSFMHVLTTGSRRRIQRKKVVWYANQAARIKIKADKAEKRKNRRKELAKNKLSLPLLSSTIAVALLT